MQTIKHTSDYYELSCIFTDLERMYAELSEPLKRPKPKLFVQPYDNTFYPILKTFEKMSGYSFPHMEFEEQRFTPIPLPQMDSKNIIVCYSGGKDSFSVIRHYQQLGYNVYAYHIKGLNKTYYDEWEVAEKMAEKLGVPLYIDSVAYKGTHCWIEHPMKNMIMATMALSWGIKNGISTKIAVGTFKTAHVADVAFEVCAGDTVEMWKLYEAIIQKVIPSFQMYIPNKNFQTAYDLLLKEPEHLPLTISCLTPNRFRKLFRRRTMRNYTIDLMPYRCGCCWKCATEYVWFCDHDVLEYNRDYYIHCLEVLLNTLEQETGYPIHDLHYVWDTYFFYSIKKSKAYEELKHAFIHSRKIKITN